MPGVVYYKGDEPKDPITKRKIEEYFLSKASRLSEYIKYCGRTEYEEVKIEIMGIHLNEGFTNWEATVEDTTNGKVYADHYIEVHGSPTAWLWAEHLSRKEKKLKRQLARMKKKWENKNG
jgi:hypothetical protein